MIRENLEQINKNIENACKNAGRELSEVHLIAVSKTKPVEMLKEAYDAGCRLFGENRVQELTEKMPVLPDDIKWHMIGHLQTNKIKYIIGKVALIHSVDTLHLAEAIDKEAAKAGCTQDVLIEINVAGESSKFGTADMDVNKQLIKDVSELKNLKLKGLMTVAPYTDDPEENRVYFKTLKKLADDMREYFDGEPVLSMGMTGDYMVAVEEGATYVRVGTGLFGERNYNF
ncbi:MAG: YggS family pyridoxal phosphate-dependent enzyme [Lachnospiraceae bacterium]|nr:YggS family pyridoxal phosphate-dependent enzyme [Lachnospiraceae bacterium]